MTNKFFYLFTFCWGIVWGSFGNVFYYRWPKGFSLLFPGSHCIHCGVTLKWWENIPILSYLFIKGRCRYCHTPISPRYLLIEFLSGIIAIPVAALTLINNQYNFILAIELFMVFFFFSWILLIIIFIDIKYMLIPDELVFLGIILGLGSSFVLPVINPFDSVIGILSGFVLIWLLFIEGYKLITGYEGMGFGDAKLLAMIGAFTGWKGVVLTLTLGCIQGLIVALIIKIIKKRDQNQPASKSWLKEKISFGPFLALGAWEYLFWADQIINLLLKL